MANGAKQQADSLRNEANQLNRVASYLEHLPRCSGRVEMLENAAFVLHQEAIDQETEGNEGFAQTLRIRAVGLLRFAAHFGGSQWDPQGGRLFSVELARRVALLRKARSTTPEARLAAAQLLKREASTLLGVAANCESNHNEQQPGSLHVRTARLRRVVTALEVRQQAYAQEGEDSAAQALGSQADVLRWEANALESAAATKLLVEDSSLESANDALDAKPLDLEVIETGIWLGSAATGVSFVAIHERGRRPSTDRWQAYVLGKPYFVGHLGPYRDRDDSIAACREFANLFRRRMVKGERQGRVDSADAGGADPSDHSGEPLTAPLKWRWIGPHLWMAATAEGASFSVYKAKESDPYRCYVANGGQITDLGSQGNLLDAKAECQIWHESCQLATPGEQPSGYLGTQLSGEEPS